MSKCGLCGRQVGEKEDMFGSFGLLPPSDKVCGDCLDELKLLYSGAQKADRTNYWATRKSFKKK